MAKFHRFQFIVLGLAALVIFSGAVGASQTPRAHLDDHGEYGGTGTTGISTTSTTGTPTTTGTATTGSSGGSSALGIDPVTVEELKSADTYKRNGSSVDHLTQHVVRVNCKVSGGWTDPDWSAPGTDYPTSVPNSAKTVFSATDDPSTVHHGSYSFNVYAVSPGEFGWSSSIFSVPTSATTTANGLMLGPKPDSSPLLSGDIVPVQLSSSGSLSGTQVTLVIAEYLQWYIRRTYTYTDSTTDYKWIVQNKTNYFRLDIDIAKLMCGDASVDTRRMFGQPNRDGVLVPDANEPLRNVKFGSWEYKGGLFVGNILGNDQSGTSRAQFYVPSGGSGTLVAGALTLVDNGSPSWLSSSIANIGLFVPGTSDANLSVTESNVNWANAWDIRPYAPVTGDYSRVPITYQSLTGTASNYANWQFRPTNAALPSVSFSKLCLALTDEPSSPSLGTSSLWRYFIAREYSKMADLGYPGNDCAPRVWRVGQVTTSGW